LATATALAAGDFFFAGAVFALAFAVTGFLTPDFTVAFLLAEVLGFGGCFLGADFLSALGLALLDVVGLADFFAAIVRTP